MKNRSIILTIIISALLIMSNFVYAADASISVTSSANQVIKGNTFKITISGTAYENITGVQAGISFDSNKLSLEDRSASKGFSEVSSEDTEIAILSTNDKYLSKSGILYTLTFKVLEDAEDGQTIVSITNPELALLDSNQEHSVEKVETKSVAIEIKTDDTTIDKDDKEEEEEEEKEEDKDATEDKDEKEDKDHKNDKNDGKKDDEDDKKVTLPQTGISIFCIVAIIIATICGILFYNKYKKIDIS